MSTTDSHQHMMGRNGTISECPKGSILDNTSVKVIFCALYILTFLLAFFGNLFTIIIIGINHKMRTATNFFLVNLAVADLLIAIFCIIQNMYHIIARSFGDWPFGDLPCKTYVYVLHLVPCTSIGILTCVSIEKYIAVLHPLKALHLLTPRMRGSIMVGIWTFSIFTNLPYFLTTNEVQFEKMSACTRNFDAGIDIKDMITISFIIWYCVPLCVLVFIYSRIGQRLWQSEISRFKEKNKNHEGELIRLHDIDSNGAISINLNSSPESSPMHSNGRNAFGKVMFRIKKTTETITDPLTDFFHRGAIVFGKQEQQSGNESRKKVVIPRF
uniref:G_PROTEIN_RECEP_F1_2 domain-containing protein n=1 Tax=Rhabditophanes sp. KR3021 TaxID=114890 RepID=A0AC35U5M7_9BILA